MIIFFPFIYFFSKIIDFNLYIISNYTTTFPFIITLIIFLIKNKHILLYIINSKYNHTNYKVNWWTTINDYFNLCFYISVIMLLLLLPSLYTSFDILQIMSYFNNNVLKPYINECINTITSLFSKYLQYKIVNNSEQYKESNFYIHSSIEHESLINYESKRQLLDHVIETTNTSLISDYIAMRVGLLLVITNLIYFLNKYISTKTKLIYYLSINNNYYIKKIYTLYTIYEKRVLNSFLTKSQGFMLFFYTYFTLNIYFHIDTIQYLLDQLK